MATCEFIKPDGNQCKHTAAPGLKHCWAHDPRNAEKRKEYARRGGLTAGKGRFKSQGTEIEVIKARISQLVRGLLDGTLPSERAGAAAQLINAGLRALEVERRDREEQRQIRGWLNPESAERFVDDCASLMEKYLPDRAQFRQYALEVMAIVERYGLEEPNAAAVKTSTISTPLLVTNGSNNGNGDNLNIEYDEYEYRKEITDYAD